MKPRGKEREGALARLVNGDAAALGEGVFVLAAHPDDETIGASVILSRCPNSTVAYLTDGAPRESRFWTGGPYNSREEYALRRQQETADASKQVGISSDRIIFLGGIDQELIYEVGTVAERLASTWKQTEPSILITHGYEGGHPDHDAAALLAFMACHLMQTDWKTAPERLEFTSYHARHGQCVKGEFLKSHQNLPEATLDLSPDERLRKELMLKSYESQQSVLKDFVLSPERLRVAPAYDFTKPPHPGKLWYEQLGWPMSGECWRELAMKALSSFGLVQCR
ncbi:MAG: hypothetical protein NVS1B11_01240 [Terriglobales bacterium]